MANLKVCCAQPSVISSFRMNLPETMNKEPRIDLYLRPYISERGLLPCLDLSILGFDIFGLK